jgi:hypothetical protein
MSETEKERRQTPELSANIAQISHNIAPKRERALKKENLVYNNE